MDANDTEQIWKAYRKKYGIYFSSNWNDNTIIRKKMGKKTLYMSTGLSTDTFQAMMKTGLEIGTNYLEDSLLAAGKKWIDRHPDDLLPRGAIQ
jgi:hypothetical protein